VGSNGPLRGEKGDLHEGGHRVPALANWPGKIAPGQVSPATAMTMDLLPTLLAVSGVPRPADLRIDGVDLSGGLLRGETIGERSLFWRDADQKAVRRGEWKLVLGSTGAELFNLYDDIGEHRNLASARPEKVWELRGELAAWERDVAAGVAGGTRSPSLR
jgi:arylsulfatase A-like enzyme